MKVEVRYHSRGGNTRRLAEAVARELGVQAATVEASMTERADVVFLCASVYAGSPDKQVVTFVKQNARDIGRLVVLSTSASGKSTFTRLKAVAEDSRLWQPQAERTSQRLTMPFRSQRLK